MTDHFDDDDPQFWDGQRWNQSGRAHRTRRAASSMRTGRVERIRSHHVVAHDESIDEPAGWSYAEADDDGYSGLADHDEDADQWTSVATWIEPERRAASRRNGAGVDPKLIRLGAIAVAAVLMIPLALVFGGDGGSGAGNQQQLRTAPDSASPVTAPGPSTIAERKRDKATTTTQASETAGVRANFVRGDSDGGEKVVATSCADTYTVVEGDYWLRFVDSSGAGVTQWLRANGADLETPMYAGDELCIPSGANAPAPPSTTDPATTAPKPTTPDPTTPTTPPPTTPPPTTQPPTTPPPTTRPPTTPPPTTQPPTTPPPTTQPPTPRTVESIIRSVWPDELEDHALVIAKRESNLDPRAKNYCCYGLFQIYYEVHRSWLAEIGVTRAEQLFDARTNALAAYTLYQRSGGWGPWDL